MAENWPSILPVRLTFVQRDQSVSAGRALDGSSLSVSSAGGYWAAVGTVKVYKEATLAYRALYASLNGESGRVLVPAYSRYRPTDMNGYQVSAAVANPLGGSKGRHPFGDTSGLGYREPMLMKTLGSAALRDTQIVVSHPNVAALQPGHYFGLGDRTYVVSKRWIIDRERLVSDANGRLTFNGSDLTYDGDLLSYGSGSTSRTGSGTSIVEFWPPLRSAVSGDTPLILGRPVCLMQFASNDTGAPDFGEDGRYGEISVEFTEAF